MFGRPGGSCSRVMKAGKLWTNLSCSRRIEDESSIRNRTSTLRLIDALTLPVHRFGSPPSAPPPPAPPPPSGLAVPPPHAAPAVTSNTTPHRTIRMRASYRSALIVAVTTWVAPSTHAGDAGAQRDVPHVTISIVGTNDLHGHIEALPRLGGYLANLRRERARTGGGVVLVDAGDMFQGTLESNLNEGAAVVRAYNALKYDAAAIGNHDFDFGPVGPATGPRARGDDPRGALKARAAEAQFPFLAANLVDEKTGALPKWPNVGATTVVARGG